MGAFRKETGVKKIYGFRGCFLFESENENS